VKRNIVCTSKVIYDNAHHAHPDNAFDYVVCHNAFEFLTKGLKISFKNMTEHDKEMPFWERLAANVDATDFDFSAFVNQRFNTFALNDEKDFVQAWFGYSDDFSRWLLKTYYMQKDGQESYLGRVLHDLTTLGTPELFSLLATLVFDESFSQQTLSQRLTLMKEAAKHQVMITDMAEQKVKAKLKAIAADPARGYYQAMKYISPLTKSELALMVEWLGNEKIERESIKALFPQLYDYTGTMKLNVEAQNIWINEYFNEASLFILQKRAPIKVIPLLDIPGNNAND